ncbi:MAG: transposase [Planctomycetaceae bacterium]|nr:transposase [Planctomycetaceae bacterium]
MRTYRRSREGSIYFFTLVTHQRRPILTTDVGRRCLRESIHEVQRDHPFEMVATVLLPDHLHAVWQLPNGDTNYSARWRLIKSYFTRRWRASSGKEATISASRRRKGERGVWQRRFYEHTCRSDEDVQRCINYIHVNPLKHKLVDRVCDWPWSTFHRYVREGYYSPDWGTASEWYGDEFKHAE